MSTQHTPGPWFTIKPHQTIYVESRIAGGMIQEVASIGQNANGWSESEANARLIAAAPELLEALIELADCGAEAWGEDRPCVRIARAAIAKATNPD